MTDQVLRIANTVLSELESFEESFKVKEFAVSADGVGARQVKETVDAQRRLLREPFMAYIKVDEMREGSSDGWQEKIYLVCRTYTPMGIRPITPKASFLNYKAPIGKIASFDVGDELEIPVPDGRRRQMKYVYILEKNVFTPEKRYGWDAVNNTLSLKDEQQFIQSFREFLQSIYAETQFQQEQEAVSAEDGVHLIERLQEIESALFERSLAEAQKRDSRRRQVVEQIALKDQPILDQVQDSFFRLPLDSQIILSGAPGTGKTTTLIKRLARYSQPESLGEEEQEALGTDRFKLLFDPQTNWVMFTPNELLKIYLKEALNKEWLPATDESVRVWDIERMQLAREVLRFLKTGNVGSFTRTTVEMVPASSNRDLIAYAESFVTYYTGVIREQLSAISTQLELCLVEPEAVTASNEEFVSRYNEFIKDCEKVLRRIAKDKERASEDQLSVIFAELSYYRERSSELRKQLNGQIEGILKGIISSHPEVIKNILPLLPPPKSEEESTTSDERKVLAKRQLRDAVLLQAERLTKKTDSQEKQSLSKTWDVVLHRIGQDEAEQLSKDFLIIGPVHQGLSEIEPVLKGHSQMIDTLPGYYQEFRLGKLQRGKGKKGYTEQEEKIRDKKLSENEIDLLIFLMLRNTRRAFLRNRSLLYSDAGEAVLRRVKSRYRVQVAVDEATDFSPLQLGCIFCLAHPDVTSISLSGDLMQRVTRYGLTDWTDVEFVSPAFRVHELAKSYRQSPKLLAVAAKLYKNIIGADAPFRSAYAETREDPEPLRFHATNDRGMGRWIVKRILEIYAINDSRLPSIAVFVPEDRDIDEVYEILDEPLAEESIEVEKCPQGKILGPGSRVRIFSVEYIKGLEFEGVFFVNIDQVYSRKPDLVDKYLYVGLTRAATFLGLTYKTEFPEKIRFVAEDFKETDWSSFAL